MIKILFFLNSKVRGGVEEHVICLLKGMDRNKFEPVVVCPEELLGLIEEDLNNISVRYHPVSIRSWFDFKEINKFLKVLKHEKPDIVHSHLFFATMFAAPLSKTAKVPIVIETAHIREAWRKGIKKAYFIDRIFYRYVDKVIAVSDAVKRYLVEEKKLSGEKISVVKNGVDIERFKLRRPEGVGVPTSSEILKETSGEPGNIVFGVIGRLEEQKGHKFLLQAIKKLKIENDKLQIKVLIAGNGSLENELKELVKEFGISNVVEFLGYREDIIDVLSAIDVLILPSLFEGLPLVVLEASAMGKAVIVTNVDGSPEAVIDGKTGLVVPSKDSEALRGAMLKFMEHKELIEEYGSNGRKNVEENFDIKKQVRETEEVYIKAVSGKL